jgi:hypothetical protein
MRSTSGVVDTMDEACCYTISRCDELEELVRLLTGVQASADASELDHAGVLELLECFARCPLWGFRCGATHRGTQRFANLRRSHEARHRHASPARPH